MARYVAVGIIAILADVGLLLACALGSIVFGIGAFGFANGLFLSLSALCLAGVAFAIFVGVRLIIPLVRFCLREARAPAATAKQAARRPAP